MAKLNRDATMPPIQKICCIAGQQRLSNFMVISKKTAQHPNACSVKRSHFYSELEGYQSQGRPIVYLDESGFKHQSYRPYGYSAKGTLRYGVHNRQLKNTTNAIATWCDNRILSPLLVKGNVNADVFYAWIQQGLIPELPKNSVIVMDNATFHKRQDIKQAIEEAGHNILWLPPYSPDLNTIKEVWAWIKVARKRWKMDDIERLLFYFCWIINDANKCTEKILV